MTPPPLEASMNEFLRSQSINQLLELRKAFHAEGLYHLEDSVSAELLARGYADVPRACTCREIAGDDPKCPIHHPKAPRGKR